jgi:hypothetical protein
MPRKLGIQKFETGYSLLKIKVLTENDWTIESDYSLSR